MESVKKTVALIILDGWGLNPSHEGNAIHAANTPNWNRLLETYPNSTISTSGLDVGLPEGQVGNSEVGHMSIGAGRTIYQNLTLINKEIKVLSFFNNAELNSSINESITKGSALHILGLLSDGGVHSHIGHITALCELAASKGLEKVYIHAFLDGRDTPPRCAKQYIETMNASLKKIGVGQIASVTGRFFAMDRDSRWERTEQAYRLIVEGISEYQTSSALSAIELSYELDKSDEFCPAVSIVPDGQEALKMEADDQVVFMNFRPDRARQLTRALIDNDFTAFPRNTVLPADQLVTLTQYASDINARCAYPPQTVENSLGEYLAAQGKTQLRIAETEKYAHVTFFFNGGSEAIFPGEERILIPSPDVATYDLKPEMSASEVKEKLVSAIYSREFDLIVCNFANGDMVGHTGDFDAAVKAVETLDTCLGQIIEAIKAKDGVALITADHGNVESMLDHNNGQAHTSHTSFPVPLLYVANSTANIQLKSGSLIDLAPTILQIMGIDAPDEMSGKTLL
ncbi:MAG: 2,3-bisphosphoglycerate-independent phosphoglycerate mutase [Neptuniibacter sp.]